MRGKGFTLVELLLASALLAVVLALGLRYFTESAQLSRENQARSDLQDRTRMVMQVVTQDLQLVGSRYWNQGTVNRAFILPADSVLVSQDNEAQDSLTLYYVTSLRGPWEACRRVDYRFTGDTLERSDANATSGQGNECTEPDPSFAPLAEGILALDIVYLCSHGESRNTSDCGPDAYPRSALVEVVARSSVPVKASTSPREFTTVSGESVPCPEGYACYSLRQEVLMPNLKPVP